MTLIPSVASFSSSFPCYARPLVDLRFSWAPWVGLCLEASLALVASVTRERGPAFGLTLTVLPGTGQGALMHPHSLHLLPPLAKSGLCPPPWPREDTPQHTSETQLRRGPGRPVSGVGS